MKKRLRDYTLEEIKEFCESNTEGCKSCPFTYNFEGICIMCVIDNEENGLFYKKEW